MKCPCCGIERMRLRQGTEVCRNKKCVRFMQEEREHVENTRLRQCPEHGSE